MQDIEILKNKIEAYYDNEKTHAPTEVLECVSLVIDMLNRGQVRAANIEDYSVNSWVKKAILLLFRYTQSSVQDFDSYDKIDLLKYDLTDCRYRKVPGAFIRNGVYIGNGCVVMPSYINIGAYIGDKTMVDINATVGSCAQIGESCHISGGSCIGGVLEPVVATPVIIEDNCFIGANAAVLEGTIVKKGAIIAAGTIISASTKIINRETGEIMPFGIVPERSVVVPGSYPSAHGVNINCAVIVKQVDESNRKVSINEILREAV